MMSTVVAELFVPRGQGATFEADQGQIVRLVQPQGGGQVVDLIPFNRDNPDERLWSSKTISYSGLHPRLGDQLISTGPWERPLMTIVGDTLPREPTPGGALFHDVMGCCSIKAHVRNYGPRFSQRGCHETMSEAVAKHGIPPHFVQDAFNAFMRTGFDTKRWNEPSDAKEGDYVELRAEQDLLIVVSCCQGKSSKVDSKGIKIEVVSE